MKEKTALKQCDIQTLINFTTLINKKKLVLFCLICIGEIVHAQSLTDGVFMPKNSFCGGLMYTHEQWRNYWEGTLKRENLNLGNVSTQSVNIMAVYGITNRLNVVLNTPYVWTHASAGTLAGMKGIQDLSVGLKFKAFDLSILGGQLVGSAIGGITTPLTNYTPDFLPLSIGLQSRTLFGRGMLYYQHESGLSLTIQGTYINRNNIKLDRIAYFTTQQINSREVAIPNVVNYSARAGYYTYRIAAEAFYEHNESLGGFDIRRNDMPFPSNNMDVTRLGLLAHYRFKALADVQIVAIAARVVSGRNVGQTSTFMIGLTKALDFNKKPASGLKK